MSFINDFEDRVGKHFRDAIKDHVMTVLREDGLYRHVRFAKPGTSMYHFDLITWPGYLAISGDMDGHIFRRLEDMFQFFAGEKQINPVYWSEKLCSGNGRKDVLEYEEDLFKEIVIDHIKDHEDEFPGLSGAVHERVFDEGCEYEPDARAWLEQFEHNGFRFTDVWEWNFRTYSYHFLWCCYAIQHGVNAYLAAKAAEQQPTQTVAVSP